MDKPRIITLDLGECQHIDEMHQRIKSAFQFPDYYGENWDAFWDLIDGTRDNTMVEIQGISTMPKELREEAGKMILFHFLDPVPGGQYQGNGKAEAAAAGF